MHVPWTPLLTGSLAEQAREVILEILTALTKSHPVSENTSHLNLARPRSADFDLADGCAGVAICLAQGAAQFPDEIRVDSAVDALSLACVSAGEFPWTLGLYQGLTGIAWASEYLSRLWPAEVEPDTSTEVDEVLVAALNGTEEVNEFDLLGGLTGIGLYALSRLERSWSRQAIARIISLLCARADRTLEGVAWKDGANRSALTGFPPHSIDLGVAHGSPGVIGFLAQAHAAGVCGSDGYDLLENAVGWLSAHRLPANTGVAFPAKITAGSYAPPARNAWCYGDAGVAAVLLASASATLNPTWEREALAIARLSAQRPVGDTGVVDAGICHGAAGLAHIFNRFFQYTGDPRFERAAVRWIRRTLSMRVPNKGIARYRGLRFVDSAGKVGWRNERGFLSGAAGIALVLMSAVSAEELTWDQVLLIGRPVFTL